MVAPNTPEEISGLTLTRDDAPIAILLVDDDADCRMLIRDAISECKVSNDVHEVENGQQAIEFLKRRGKYANVPRPGLIYMDIEMPVMNGLEAVKVIKADPEIRDIPLVMMTGVSDENQMRRGAPSRADSQDREGRR